MQIRELYAYRRFERNLIGLLALMFVVSGLFKFFAPALLPLSFASFGYPVWFAYVVALAEIGGGILLLGQRSCFYGASLLGLILFGAFLTHLIHGQNQLAVVPLALMCQLLMLAHLHSERVVAQVERLLRWYELDGKIAFKSGS
ncbi:MAG: hypothetical protein CVV27_07755 [Candidatus Melainabacteria bacterium HGW-Melainabacteria-1]|nr:MAG: hypothetical protein CVV27_07755 [Candidatus Melainabacteria bacterium HGW-Melainabacteria-1]